MNQINLDFSALPNKPVPQKDVIDLSKCPEYEKPEVHRRGRKPYEDPEFIATPGYHDAEEPQPRIIKDEPEDISELVYIHQRMEVLEYRIRSNKTRSGYATDQVAQLYDIMPNFKIDRSELFFLETYNLPPNDSQIPDFWPPRIYDREDEKMSKEQSKKLKKDIDKTKKIVMVERVERTDWREMRRLLKIVEAAEGQIMMKERKSRGSMFDPTPPPNAGIVKRKLQPSGLILSWDNENLMTDSTSDETEVEDFVL